MDNDVAYQLDLHKAALRAILNEVEHKKGGPERDDCVSIPYIYGICRRMLGLPVEEQQWKPRKCEQE